MKKIKTFSLSTIMIIGLTHDGQAQSSISNVFKINPFSLVVGNCNLFYERKISNISTLQLGFNFMPQPIKSFGASFTCFGITPEWRIYISNDFIDVPGGG